MIEFVRFLLYAFKSLLYCIVMQTIIIENEHLCAYTDGQSIDYVPYSGEIAGLTSHADLKGDTEILEGRPDEIKLDR